MSIGAVKQSGKRIFTLTTGSTFTLSPGINFSPIAGIPVQCVSEVQEFRTFRNLRSSSHFANTSSSFGEEFEDKCVRLRDIIFCSLEFVNIQRITCKFSQNKY